MDTGNGATEPRTLTPEEYATEQEAEFIAPPAHEATSLAGYSSNDQYWLKMHERICHLYRTQPNKALYDICKSLDVSDQSYWTARRRLNLKSPTVLYPSAHPRKRSGSRSARGLGIRRPPRTVNDVPTATNNAAFQRFVPAGASSNEVTITLANGTRITVPSNDPEVLRNVLTAIGSDK